MRVRCKVEEGDKDKFQASDLIPPPLQKVVDTDTSELTPPPTKKVSPNFIDVMAFAGPGPERINGRLAMIGFVSAIQVEIINGQDLFTQISNGGFQWFLGASILLTVASLIPFLRGIGPAANQDPVMNPDAELWNGRFAMIGLVALAITEYFKGGALI